MRRILAALVTVVLFGAGCSSESGPSADVWAASVCSALGSWRSAITDLNQRAAIQMTQTTTTEQTRGNLVELVTDARDATEQARAAVAAAGVPAVAGGEQVARGFEASLAQTRDAYASAATQLGALPGGDETTFYDGVVAVMDHLSDQYAQAGADLTTLDSPELRGAFDRAPECR